MVPPVRDLYSSHDGYKKILSSTLYQSHNVHCNREMNYRVYIPRNPRVKPKCVLCGGQSSFACTTLKVRYILEKLPNFSHSDNVACSSPQNNIFYMRYMCANVMPISIILANNYASILNNYWRQFRNNNRQTSLFHAAQH